MIPAGHEIQQVPHKCGQYRQRRHPTTGHNPTVTRDEEEKNDPPLVLDAGVEAALAGAGLVLQGPEAAIAGAVAGPYVLDLVHRSWDHIRQRSQQAAARMIGTASAELGQEPRQMLLTAVSTNSGTEILAEALRAAAGTLNEQKIVGLARALANGLANDQAALDHERLVIRALADIEEPHLAILARMTGDRMPPRRTPRQEAAAAWFHPWKRENEIRHWLLNPDGNTSSSVVTPIIHTLERNGLIEDNQQERADERDKAAKDRMELELRRLDPTRRGPRPSYVSSRPTNPERRWRITGFGDFVLQHLENSRPLAEPAEGDNDDWPFAHA